MTEANKISQESNKSKGRRMIPLVLLLAVGIGGLSFGALRAQGEGNSDVEAEKPVAASASQDAAAWAIRCEDIKEGEKPTGQYCEMMQNITITQKDQDPANNGQRLIEMAIGYPASEKGKAFAAVILPLGILVNKEVEVEIDGSKGFDFKIAYCDAGGCLASFHIDARDMEKLSKGKIMTIKTIAATGQPVAIEMSLAGFGDARDRIKSSKV
jgi:invasion protein IalB